MESAMEQTRYWMWERSRSFSSRPNNFSLALTAPPALPSFDSWEEAAFAKDSAGDLWGCIWPPRSYTCSFCCREFRSAQALGGHMNVHRRDRARLKHEASSSSNSEESPNPNPNPNSQSAVSLSLQAQEICSKNTLLASSFPEIPQSLTNVSIDLKLGERDCWRRDDESLSYKKLKSSDGMALSLSRKNTESKHEHHLPPLISEVLNLRTCQVEELDLELRLGKSPKVKQSCSIIVIE